jgi:RNA polymerase sigma factor (sigma-70 family)
VLPQVADLPALLAATARADRDAFRELYGRTAPKLLAVIARILRDRAAAEDVLQDVYLRVWQNAASYSADTARPMTWLIAIARNRSLDVMRQRRDVLIAPADDGTDWFDAIPEGRDREAEFIDLDRLRVCLGRLDETQRRCLLAAYYDGFSREELAERYRRPVNTIKTWLHRGASALRSCLEEA